MPEITGSLRPPRSSAPPSSPVVGELYYDTDDNVLYWWNGTAWVSASGGAGGPPSGAAGGGLTGTYPNPTIAASGINNPNQIAYSTIEGRSIYWHEGPTSPGGASDGDLWLYPVASTLPVLAGYWLFMYDSTEATYKWKCVGGTPLFSQDLTARSASWTANTWMQPYSTNNPALTVPFTGHYIVQATATIIPNLAATSWIGIKIGATNPTLDASFTAGGYHSVASARQTLVIHHAVSGFSASSALSLVYQYNAATGNVSRTNATLGLMPVQVS